MFSISNKKDLAAYVIIASITLFHCFTIRDAPGWGDDFALYIAHAKNIVEGIPYTDTGFLHNTDYSAYSPAQYPPGFPVLLAGVYALAGLNFYYFKLMTLVFLYGCLLVFYHLFRDQFSVRQSSIMLFFFGCAPFIWDLKNTVLSDIPFLFFTLLSFLLYDKYIARKKMYLLLLCGFSALFAYSIRSVGIAIVPAIVLSNFIAHRKITGAGIILFSMFTAGYFFLRMIIPSDEAYLSIFTQGYAGKNLSDIGQQVYVSIKDYFNALEKFTLLGNSVRVLNYILVKISFVFFLAGFFNRIRKQCTHYELFVLFYFIIIVLFPGFQGVRYLLPLIPFYIWYVCIALQAIRWNSIKKMFTYLFCAGFGIVFLIFYSHSINAAPSKNFISTPASLQLYDFIKNNTDPQDVMMSAKPRVLALFTSRRGTIFPDEAHSEKLYADIKRFHAAYFISGAINNLHYFEKTLETDTTVFTPVFHNDLYTVYAISESYNH